MLLVWLCPPSVSSVQEGGPEMCSLKLNGVPTGSEAYLSLNVHPTLSHFVPLFFFAYFL